MASTAYVALYSDDGNNKPTLTGGRLGHASIATTANGFRENGADLGIALTPCYFWAFVVCTHGVSLTFTPASPTMPQLVDSDTGGSSAGRFAHIQQSGLTGITEAPATIAPDGNIGSAPVMWLK